MSRRSCCHAGYTLLEVIVVLLVSLLVLILLLPRVQVWREEARRQQCRDNLKQIGLALHNYHDVYVNYFPSGCTGAAKSMSQPVDDWGYSWWVPILPHLDQAALYNQWNFSVPSSGYDGQLALLKHVKIPQARCPSTTLTKYQWTPDGLAVATYVGVAGGVEFNSEGIESVSTPSDSIPLTTNVPWSKLTANGIHSSNGMFGWASETARYSHQDQDGMYVYTFYGNRFVSQPEFAGQEYSVILTHLGIKNALDGSSNTLFLVEQSGLARNQQDGSKTIAISSWPNGMWCGTLNQDRYFNVTTFRHPVNYDQSEGGDQSTDCQTTGVCANLGNNNPIQSAHKNGANVLLVDGTVRFLSNTTDYAIVHCLAVRNGGRPVNGY